MTFYLVPGFAMLALSSAIEALRLANRVLGYRAYDWRLISETGMVVRANCGSSLLADSCLEAERKRLFQADRPSMSIVCADDNVEQYFNKSLEAWLRDCRQRRILVGALGTGAYVLARAGLLGNRRCTIHWEKEPGFTETFNSLLVNTNIYAIDGDIWTCAGGSAPFDMMLQLVEQTFGESTVASICELGLVNRMRKSQERQRLPFSCRHQISNEIVIKVIGEMEKHIEEPLPTKILASKVGLSSRQVERLFRFHLNHSPVLYYRKLRIERAKFLLIQTAMPVVEIAIACGFVSASHFSNCFRQIIGMSPNQARNSKCERAIAGTTEPSLYANSSFLNRVLDHAA
ncbi:MULTISPECIES: GlxA family transcriptional regulator [unclassified Mesorhizobium]|uniref:GlxA family transcriptional regulator n=1 Tax=unclassified Mesorhizobium TaxID=325217 RepID=UPI001FEE1A69|nr:MULTISPECIES: GlxA family transcriptional regulator [unclassified Mesorhizobium]